MADSFLEIEKGNVPLAISYEGAESVATFTKAGMAPLGSAAITGSGNLKEKGISHIIHAAAGSMTRSEVPFKPSLTGVKLSVNNALRLAERYGISPVALPFIGSGIFLSRMGADKEDLAEIIIETAAQKESVKAKIVAYSQEDFDLFKKLFLKLSAEKRKRIEVLKGSITDFDLHRSKAIVNAANTELTFGGGVSGVIGKASGKPEKINSDCRKLIKALGQSIQ